MNRDDLKIALAIDRHGSLTRAAADLKVDQSTVSRRLDALEAQIGATLFTRSRRELTATQAGEQAVRRAREIEQRVSSLA